MFAKSFIALSPNVDGFGLIVATIKDSKISTDARDIPTFINPKIVTIIFLPAFSAFGIGIITPNNN